MTQENKRGELVGCPARESELESSNLKNTGVILSLINTNITPKAPNPILTENPNPTQSPPEKPIAQNPEKPVPNSTKKPNILFLELRKLRRPGRGVQMTLYNNVIYRTYQKGDDFWGRIASEKDLNTWKERNRRDEII